MSTSAKIVCAAVLVGLGCLALVLRCGGSSRESSTDLATTPDRPSDKTGEPGDEPGDEQDQADAPSRTLPSLPDPLALQTRAKQASAVFDSESRDNRWASARERSLEIAVAKHRYPGSSVKSIDCRQSVCAIELGGQQVVRLVEALSEDTSLTAESRSLALSRHDPPGDKSDEAATIVVFLSYDR